MNYQRIYDALIEKARVRTVEGYSEKHHVTPRCLGGSNKPTNLVRLTPEEHYLAHQLLVKIHPNNANVAMAVQMMTLESPGCNVRANKLYGWARRLIAKHLSERATGSRNPQFGTVWITDGEKNRKLKATDDIPDGWKRGKTTSEHVKQVLRANALKAKGKPGRKHTTESRARIKEVLKDPNTSKTKWRVKRLGRTTDESPT